MPVAQKNSPICSEWNRTEQNEEGKPDFRIEIWRILDKEFSRQSRCAAKLRMPEIKALGQVDTGKELTITPLFTP